MYQQLPQHEREEDAPVSRDHGYSASEGLGVMARLFRVKELRERLESIAFGTNLDQQQTISNMAVAILEGHPFRDGENENRTFLRENIMRISKELLTFFIQSRARVEGSTSGLHVSGSGLDEDTLQ